MPVRGGILDQPGGLIINMEALQNIYNVFQSYQNKGDMTAGEWAEAYPGADATYRAVETLRLEDG